MSLPSLSRSKLLQNRLRVLASKNETTVEHLLAVCLALAFPLVEKLSAAEFRAKFGQGRRFRYYAAKQNRKRRKRIETHIELVRKKEVRREAVRKAVPVGGSLDDQTEGWIAVIQNLPKPKR